MMNQIMECIPNFSEGRDLGKVEKIADAFRGKEGVKLLDSLEKELESAKQRLTVLRQGENGDDVEEPLGGM